MSDGYYKKVPGLSGDEEVVAHAGEGKDNWADAKAEGTIGLIKVQVNHDGKLTAPYKKLLEQLHMFDSPPGKILTDKEKKKAHVQILELNRQWRQIQKRKAETKLKAEQRIELQRDGYVRS